MSHNNNKLFCGIDVAKRGHVACLIDPGGAVLLKPFKFANDVNGFSLLRQRLDEARQGKPLLIGMEATGHYWYALYEYLAAPAPTGPNEAAHDVVVLNPLQTAQQAHKEIRKTKTDKKDAQVVATVVKNNGFRPTVIPRELAATCRQLTRLWYALRCQRTRIKQLLGTTLEWLWPEFESHFADLTCATAQAVLRLAPSPEALLRVDLPTLTEVIATVSRRKLGEDVARRLIESARVTVGARRGREGGSEVVTTLLLRLQADKPVLQHLREKIEAMVPRIPACLLTIPGVTALSAVSLFGEVDPISTFARPDQLVAFAGLDPVVFQTGQYDANHRHVSKRGSPHLRRTLWLMAMGAVLHPGPMRDYYQRRRKAGLHHSSALTAVALKLCRITWRILTDQRDYTPEPPKKIDVSPKKG